MSKRVAGNEICLRSRFDLVSMGKHENEHRNKYENKKKLQTAESDDETETSSESVSVDHIFVCKSKLNIKPRTRLRNVSR